MKQGLEAFIPLNWIYFLQYYVVQIIKMDNLIVNKLITDSKIFDTTKFVLTKKKYKNGFWKHLDLCKTIVKL